jgi:DNA-binding MarR family transcriptional regulator
MGMVEYTHYGGNKVSGIKQNRRNNPLEPEVDIDFELWVLLDHSRRALVRARELELSQFGITQEQAGVLHTLLDNGGSLTNAEIADIMIRQSNSVTTLVTRMEKLGLVKKTKSANDVKIIVSITPKGRSIYEKVTTKSIHMAFSDLSIKDKQKLIKYFKHLTAKGRHLLGMDQKLPILS